MDEKDIYRAAKLLIVQYGADAPVKAAMRADAMLAHGICPNGKELRTSGTAHDGTTLEYIARRSDCERCPLKQRCTSGRERRVQHDVNETARDYARSLVATEAFDRSRCERKKVEMLFAHLKRHLGFERIRLRGLSGAQDELLLAATVQNLKRLARLTTIPPPRAAMV